MCIPDFGPDVKSAQVSVEAKMVLNDAERSLRRTLALEKACRDAVAAKNGGSVPTFGTVDHHAMLVIRTAWGSAWRLRGRLRLSVHD